MKFSIVTPTCNSERFFAETIRSVLAQEGDFSIEYIVVDNLSSDRTVEILEKEMAALAQATPRCKGVDFKLIRQKDGSMYEAINSGFAVATGDLFAWINSDDIYLPGAFAAICRAFSAFPEISWLKGITSYIDEDSVLYEQGQCRLYRQEWISKGLYGRDAFFIQQDSVFWKAGLWRKTGGVPAGIKVAGDYYLWTRFARETPLYSLRALVSCFRKARGQLSQDLAAYREEMARMAPARGLTCTLLKFYFLLEAYLPRQLRPLIYQALCFGGNHAYLEMERDEPVLKAGNYYLV